MYLWYPKLHLLIAISPWIHLWHLPCNGVHIHIWSYMIYIYVYIYIDIHVLWCKIQILHGNIKETGLEIWIEFRGFQPCCTGPRPKRATRIEINSESAWRFAGPVNICGTHAAPLGVKRNRLASSSGDWLLASQLGEASQISSTFLVDILRSESEAIFCEI